MLGIPTMVPLTVKDVPVFDAMLKRISEYRQAIPEHAFVNAYRKDIVDVSYSKLAVSAEGTTYGLADFDPLIICMNWFFAPYIEYLRQAFPNKRIIGIQDDSLAEVMLSEAALQRSYLNAIACLDSYVALNEDMFQWASAINSATMLMQHPFDPMTLGPRISFSHSQSLVCTGIASWNIDFSNFTTNLLVYDRLRALNDDLRGETIGLFDFQKKQIEPIASAFRGIRLREWFGDDFLCTISKFGLVLNLTRRVSCSRVAVDCAIAGTPIIGNRSCDLQRILWPELAVDPLDIASAQDLAAKVISSPNFSAKIVADARKRLSAICSAYGRAVDSLHSMVEGNRKRGGT
jgi:hypothetical protein